MAVLKTKGDYINEAYEELRISGLTVNPTPAENASALNKLENMMYELENRNYCFNYLFEEEPNPATVANVQPQFNHAIQTNLAIRLLAAFGKSRSDTPDLFSQAVQSMSAAASSLAQVNETQYPRRMATGSGNTFRFNRYRRFQYPPAYPVISCETNHQELNTQDSYTESWDNNLPDGELITDINVTVTRGLELLSSAIGGDSRSVDYTVKTNHPGANIATIEIVTAATTPNNRDVRTVNFNVINNLSQEN